MSDLQQSESQQPSEQPFQRVVSEYLRQVDVGADIDLSVLCDGDATLIAEMEEFIAGEQMLLAVAKPPEPVTQQSIDTSRAEANRETIKPGTPAEMDAASLVGAMVGRYQVLSLLGAGAMGSVYLAEDTALKRRVALKVPKLLHPGDAEYLQRFHREARAIAGLSHPNICPVFDIGEEQGHPFIAMAYIQGEPLSQCLGKPEFRDQHKVATILAIVARALQHAHDAGTIHRDLKPGNVLIDGAGQPIVTDFGLARRIGEADESRITQQGAILGTPAYMSPEQVDGQWENIGPHSDIYALGAMAYELLAGKLPFLGSIASILGQIARDRPAPIRKHRADVAPELEDLALQMLEKLPSNRPSSMSEVAERLERWMKNNSPEAVHQQKIESKAVDKLTAGQRQIEQLLKQGNYARAIQGLEQMSALKDPLSQKFVDWAKEQLKRVQSIPRQIRENLPMVLSTAQNLVKKHDYAQAAEMLQQVPADVRPEPMRKLLEQAVELQEESDLLLLSLQESVKSRNYTGINDNLKRFLELKPGNRFAKELLVALKTYSKTPLKDRKYQHDEKGRLLPQRVNSLWDNWLLWGSLCFVLVLGVTLWGVMLYLNRGDVAIAVEVDPALLAAGDLKLVVDGDEYKISSSQFESVTIQLGEHDFSVLRDGTTVHAPKRFDIAKDGRTLLSITPSSLELRRPDAEGTGNIASTTPAENPGIGTVPAVETGGVPSVNLAPLGPSSPPSKVAPSSDAFAGRKLQDRWQGNSMGMPFHWIPPGRFRMGSELATPIEDNEVPVDVNITRGMWVGVYELTQKQWREIMGFEPWMGFQDKQVNDNNAATHITWNEAVDYCQRLTLRERRLGNIPANWEFRLPSEAEWEYFARAGSTTMYHFGDDPEKLSEYAWWKANTQDVGEGYAHEVGQLKPNPWGLYDIHGNVYEHCYDSFEQQLPGGDDPVRVNPPIAAKVSRGGGWAYWGPESLRSSGRYPLGRETRRNRLGIRLVLAEVTPNSASQTAKVTPVSTKIPGLKLASNMALSGTFLQPAPAATYKIEVRLKALDGNIWKGEMEAFETTTLATGEAFQVGFVIEVEFEVLSEDSAQLVMRRIASLKPGFQINVPPGWIEQLKWDGTKFSNAAMSIVPPLSAYANRPPLAGSRSIPASEWDILPQGANRDWQRSGDTLVGKRGADPSIAWTRDTYNDFQISVEFQCSTDANGGILLRSPVAHAGGTPAMEVHLGDGRSNDLHKNGTSFCGGLYITNEGETGLDEKSFAHVDLSADQNAYRPGEWNRLTIRLVGPEITVQLNNILVQQRDLNELKLPYPHFGNTLDRASGYVGLQCYEGTVSYRKFSIQPL
ncbi:MAG: SUMF1/EgtB/PvdO family nonheme iron enzyme [Planctomycetaceae bacterium]